MRMCVRCVRMCEDVCVKREVCEVCVCERM